MTGAFLGEVVAHYRRRLDGRLVAVALYGSRARGQARADSDVDLFLVVEGLPADLEARALALEPPRRDIWRDPPVSVRALTPEEFERDIAPVDLDVAIDARILHDCDGYLASRLALIRQRIEEAGLVRDERLFWRWKDPPRSCDWAIRWAGVRK